MSLHLEMDCLIHAAVRIILKMYALKHYEHIETVKEKEKKVLTQIKVSSSIGEH